MCKLLTGLVIFLIITVNAGLANEEEKVFFSSENLEIIPPSETITFRSENYQYEIDAEGFKSLTREEALNIVTVIYLMSTFGIGEELGDAILERFMPERFKVKDKE